SLNLGVVKTEADRLLLRYSIRSSVGAEKEALVEQIRQAVRLEGALMEINGDYPAWEYRKESPLRDDCVRIYKELFGKEPKVEAIHAGLECGILASKIPDLDCVSMGPDMSGIHTTEERLCISSVERMWNYLLELLKR
ncbi:MAG: M20/M25/M40 family metallo-hydrolase, partial [Lachnospiraceae bacterium]|nr:M20/M25/M40 family metallo-hydrolase [Lachnospiraceae bacterium]